MAAAAPELAPTSFCRAKRWLAAAAAGPRRSRRPRSGPEPRPAAQPLPRLAGARARPPPAGPLRRTLLVPPPPYPSAQPRSVPRWRVVRKRNWAARRGVPLVPTHDPSRPVGHPRRPGRPLRTRSRGRSGTVSSDRPLKAHPRRGEFGARLQGRGAARARARARAEPAPLGPAGVPFSLSLTDRERADRAAVALPYQRHLRQPLPAHTSCAACSRRRPAIARRRPAAAAGRLDTSAALRC